MEELLRQAFQLGQQWVQDMNNDKEPTNFNQWYASNEVQEQVKNCVYTPTVIKSCETCSKLGECKIVQSCKERGNNHCAYFEHVMQ